MGAFGKLKWHLQVLIVAGACAGLLAGAWYWQLRPISLQNETDGAKVKELNAKIEKSEAQRAVFEQFKRDVAELQVQLDELKKVLPQDKETDQILTQVQAAARSAGLRIQSGVSRPIIDHDVYTEWPLTMEVVGTYHNLGAFLDKIRQLPRIVNIGKLKVDGRASEGENAYTASIGATYEATTFVYREESVDTAPAAKPVKAAK